MEKSLIQEITEIKDKATKYDNIVNRNDEYAKHINNAIEILKKVSADLAPFQAIQGAKRMKSEYDYKNLAKEFYDLMIHGTQISSDLILSTYPGMTDQQIHYIKVLIKKMTKVEERKEDGKTYLYVLREE